DDPVRPARPAEAHFLVMLGRDLAAKPPPALAEVVAQALALRIEAERVAVALAPTGHAYAERAWPWTRAAVEQADAKRQAGQDLLFASGAADWKKAAALLSEAAKLYAQARADGAVVRAACAARDRVLYELPLHARWLAGSGETTDAMKAATGLFEK